MTIGLVPEGEMTKIRRGVGDMTIRTARG